jgi:hypothetical protein
MRKGKGPGTKNSEEEENSKDGKALRREQDGGRSAGSKNGDR